IDHPFCLDHETSKVDALYLLAEARFRLGAVDTAERFGIRALEVLEPKIKKDPAQWTEKFDIRLELMQRISEASGRPVEAKFYRSKLSPAFLAATRDRNNKVTEFGSLGRRVMQHGYAVDSSTKLRLKHWLTHARLLQFPWNRTS